MRACETVGALEEEEETVLDPSLTPLVTLDATFPMSPLRVSFPSGKQQDSICTVGLGQRGTDEGKVASGGDRGWRCSRQAQAFAAAALTLEGVVVGLDALTDGLLQVPLLYTLDPQVLEAEAPPGISPTVSRRAWALLPCPLCPFSPTHSPGEHFVLKPLEWSPTICHHESHSLLWLTRPCALAPGPSCSPCRLPNLCHRGFFPFSKHMKLIPTSKAFAPVHSAGRVPSVLLCFPTFRSYLREALLTSQSKGMRPAPSPPPPRALLPNYYCFIFINEMVTP